jgi:hypothetical protein
MSALEVHIQASSKVRMQLSILPSGGIVEEPMSAGLIGQLELQLPFCLHLTPPAVKLQVLDSWPAMSGFGEHIPRVRY